MSYAESRLLVGEIHSRIGLEPKWFFAAMGAVASRAAAAVNKSSKTGDSPNLRLAA